MPRSLLYLLIGLALAGIAMFKFIAPIPQPQWYHQFADRRSFVGIANFWDVLSNLPLLVVGVWGICHLQFSDGKGGIKDSAVIRMYMFFFLAMALTGLGSAYYHLAPDNQRLVWDRLPLAVMLMALLAVIVTERAHRRAGILLFFVLPTFGAATVYYWHLTESWGRGDLRPYLLMQLYPAVAIPLILWFCPQSHTKTEKLYSAVAWYAGAKLYEFLDKEIYALGHLLSGHTLKHIGAGISCYMILSWLRERDRVTAAAAL